MLLPSPANFSCLKAAVQPNHNPLRLSLLAQPQIFTFCGYKRGLTLLLTFCSFLVPNLLLPNLLLRILCFNPSPG
jgi:hypothetical protein